MGIALSLKQYLDGQGAPYDIMTHERTVRSSATAKASAIPESRLAKGVLIKHKDGFLLAIVPASRHVQLDAVGEWLQQPAALATEAEVSRVFADCERGSIPPVAAAYDLAAVIDDSLEGIDDIYFEGGDHTSIVHLKGSDYQRMMATVPHAHISRRNH
jgi:Ala-tRNA(Pro) deacylase